MSGKRDLTIPALLLPAAVGVALRLYRIRDQFLVGDELHTVKAAIAMPVSEILATWTYRQADYCVPLTAFFRALMDGGVVLSEMHLRAPSLVAGLVSLFAIPMMLAPRIGRRAAIVLGWLLALSPMLVLYSRVVRSYMISTLLAFAAVMAFEHWWRTRRRRSAAVYVVFAALALYFHLGAASFVLAPFVYASLALAFARAWSSFHRLGVLMAVLVLAISLLLWPARDSLVQLVGMHGGGRLPSPSAWLHIIQLEVGTASLLLLALFGVFLSRGIWISLHAGSRLALYVSTLAIAHGVGLLILSPNFLEHPVVASRYLLPLLPFLLACCALGLAHPPERALSFLSGRVQLAAIALLLCGLFAAGPFARREFGWSSFIHTTGFIDLATPEDRMDAADVPAFYRRLGRAERPREVVLEYPWDNTATHSLRAYQQAHHAPVLVSVAAPRKLHDPRLALRNMIRPDPETILLSPARFLVVHPNIRAEEARVHTAEAQHAQRLAGAHQLWEILRLTGSRMEVRLRSLWGPPVFEDASIRVWDLEALRRKARTQLEPGAAP